MSMTYRTLDSEYCHYQYKDAQRPIVRKKSSDITKTKKKNEEKYVSRKNVCPVCHMSISSIGFCGC